MPKLEESITDPAHDMGQKGIVILTRGQNALLKDAVRLRISEIEKWLEVHDPPNNPWADRSKNVAQIQAYRAALRELREAQMQLAAWLGERKKSLAAVKIEVRQ